MPKKELQMLIPLQLLLLDGNGFITAEIPAFGL